MSVGKQVRHHTWFALKYYFKCKKMIVLGELDQDSVYPQ